MRRRIAALSALALLVGFTAPADAATIVSTGTDTFLRQSAPDTESGTLVRWGFSGDDPVASGQENHGLLRFDLDLDTPTPQGSLRQRILASSGFRATLRLNVADPGQAGDLHRLTQGFDDTSTWNSFGGGVSPGVNAQATSNASAPGTAGTLEVDVTADLLAWANGETDHGWAFLPTGTDGVEITAFDAGAGGPELLLQQQVQLLTDGPTGSTWRYYDQIADGDAYPGPDAGGNLWNEVGFDDALWLQGQGTFGYGNLTGATIDTQLDDTQGGSCNPANPCSTTVLFRTAFDVTMIPDELAVEILRDDGFVLYVNGQEVLRDNMDPGAFDATTPANDFVVGQGENMLNAFSLDPADLNVGSNEIAVEIHNYSGSSSDLGFALRLIAFQDLPNVPEPGTGFLLGMGLVGIALHRRRVVRRRAVAIARGC